MLWQLWILNFLSEFLSPPWCVYIAYVYAFCFLILSFFFFLLCFSGVSHIIGASQLFEAEFMLVYFLKLERIPLSTVESLRGLETAPRVQPYWNSVLAFTLFLVLSDPPCTHTEFSSKMYENGLFCLLQFPSFTGNPIKILDACHLPHAICIPEVRRWSHGRVTCFPHSFPSEFAVYTYWALHGKLILPPLVVRLWVFLPDLWFMIVYQIKEVLFSDV